MGCGDGVGGAMLRRRPALREGRTVRQRAASMVTGENRLSRLARQDGERWPHEPHAIDHLDVRLFSCFDSSLSFSAVPQNRQRVEVGCPPTGCSSTTYGFTPTPRPRPALCEAHDSARRMGWRVLSPRAGSARGRARSQQRTRTCRTSDRRLASTRCVFCAVCERFQRAVEADDGSLGYLFERAGIDSGCITADPAEVIDRRFERTAARDRHPRTASGRFVFSFRRPAATSSNPTTVDVQFGIA